MQFTMENLGRLKAFFLALIFISDATNGKDAVHSKFATGSDVVTAAIRKLQDTCIFPNDNLFLRRLAYVQNRDGLNLQSAEDFDKGGIWKINSNMFSPIRRNPSPFSDQIASQLGVNVDELIWKNNELEVPMNSLVSARLFIDSISNTSSSLISMNISKQAEFWVNNFNSMGTPEEFIEALSDMPECKPPSMDIIFAIDSSGSMKMWEDNYELTKTFLKKFIMGIGSQHTIKIGIVLIGDKAEVVFPLNDNLVKAFEEAQNLPFLNQYGNIPVGLNVTHQEFIRNGRAGVPKVTILITDGEPTTANDTMESLYPITQAEATSLKNSGVTLFAIAVGNFNFSKMIEWASYPSCMHFYKLDTFDELADSFPALLNFQLCDISVTLSLEQTCVFGTVNRNQHLFYIIEAEANKNASITLQLNNGGAILYTSNDTRLPSSAEYDFMAIGNSTAPVEMAVAEVSTLYASVVGTEENESTFTLCRQYDSKTTTPIMTSTTTQLPSTSTTKAAVVPITPKSKWFDINANLHWLDIDASPHAHHYYYHH